MNSNSDTEIYDLMDILNFTLSKEFLEKWRFKYGERLIKLFQIKILDSLKNSKNLKVKSIFKFLTKDSGFSEDVIKNFFIDVDISLYHPIIVGSLKEI